MASKEAEAFLQQVREYQKQALGSATAVPTLEEMRCGAETVHIRIARSLLIWLCRAKEMY